MRAAVRRLAVPLLVLPLLAGCFAGTEPDSDAADRRLRVAISFVPIKGFSLHSDDSVRLSQIGVVEGLTRLDTDGAVQPALATEWTRTDELSWRFTLRKATFHDGTPVTAPAVVTALTRAEQATPRLRVLTGLRLTATAEADDTVTVRTDVADPLLPQRLASPALSVLAPKAYAAADRVDPIRTGTGPFTLTRVDGAQRATLDRFDGYWDGRAQSAGIDVSFIPDGTARANALRAGEVDVVDTIPVAQAAVLAPENLRQVPTTRTIGLYLNTKKGVFADPAVRAAARTAVETGPLVEGVYESRADAGQGLFGPALPWAAGKRTAPQRTAPAKVPAGTRITLATYTNRPELPETATVLQQQLERAGFVVQQDVREYSQLEPDALAGTFDALVLSRSAGQETGDPVSQLASDFTCAGSYNLAKLCDRTVDDLVAKAAALDDPATRQDAIMRAEAAILGTDAVVPLVHERIIQGVAAGIQGVLLDPREQRLIGPGTRAG